MNKTLLDPQDLSQRVLDQKFASKDKGTCQWIFKHEEFTAWHETTVSDLLWLFARGGYGKSVLMSNVIRHIQEEDSFQDQTSVVTYFFCVNAGTADATHNIDRIKKDIIYALYETTKANHEVLVEANRLFVLKDKKHQPDAAQGSKSDSKGQRSTANDGLPDLDDLLIGLARLLKRRLFIAIDALDECVGDVEELFSSFDYWLEADGTDIKLLVSSRPEPHLVERLHNRRKIDVEKNTQLDIAKRTDAALAKIPGLDRSERKLVRSRIIEKAGGQFTYVNTATDFLRQPWDRPIENLLNRLQNNMDNLYQEALKNTDPRYMELAKSALTWTLLRKGSLDVVHFFDIYSKRYTFANKVSEREKSPEVEQDQTSDTPDSSEQEVAEYEERKRELAVEEERRKTQEIEHYREQIAKAAGNILVVNQHGFLEEKHQTVRECFIKSTNTAELETSSNSKSTALNHEDHICAICHQDREARLDFVISKEQGHLEIALSLLENLNSAEFRDEFFYEPESEAEEAEAPETVSGNGSAVEPNAAVESEQTPDQEVTADETDNVVESLENSAPVSNGDDPVAEVALATTGEAEEPEKDADTTMNDPAEHVIQQTTPETSNADPQTQVSEETSPEGAVESANNGEGQEEAKQDEEDVIRCICESVSNQVAIVRCDGCNTWQHIHCYFWPRENLRTNRGHVCVVCKPEDRALDVEAAKERQRILEEPEPEADNEEGDEDSEDELEEPANETVATANQGTEQPKSHVRYEIYNWTYHLKEAERAAGTESKKDSELWQRVWAEARTFLTNRKRLSNWIKTVRAGPEAEKFWFLVGDEPPLHFATAYGLTWVVKNLIEASEDTSEKARPLGEQPLHFLGYDAEMNNDIELLEILLEHNDPNVKFEDSSTCQALFTLLKNDPDLPFIESLHKHKADWTILNDNDYHWNVMSTVAFKGTHPEIVPFLCQTAKADINHPDDDGDTPLHVLLSRRSMPLDLLKAFLNENANVNAESHISERPLLGASKNGELAAVKLLFEESVEPVEVNDQDIYGAAALHSAAAYGHYDLVQYLVEMKAEVNGITFKGNTPFRHACTNSTDSSALFLLQKLKSDGYPIDQIDLLNVKARTPLRKACLYGHTLVVEELMSIPGMSDRLEFADHTRARTPLHVAAWKGHDKIVNILLSNGADHLKLDQQKKRPMQLCYEAWASGSKGGYEATTLLLIEHDTSTAMTDTGLLHAAATVGSTKVLQRLLEIGANLNTLDKHGWSPLQTTRHLGHVEAAAMLEHGLVSGQRPTRLLPLRSIGVRPSPDPNVLRKYGTDGFVSFVSDHPIPAGVHEYYFEVEIRGDSTFGIGFTTHPGSRKWRNWIPGWPWHGVQSYGYHSDGETMCSHSPASLSGRRFPGLARGDIVGCNINFASKTVSLALNGQWLGVAFEDVAGRLYPVVSMFGYDSAFKVNLGLDPDTPFLRAGESDSVAGVDRVVDGQRLPTRLLAPDPAVLRLDANKFACEEEDFRYALLANHPIPTNLEVYYFEVDVLSCNLEELWFVAIGLTTQATTVQDWTPGWRVEDEVPDRRSYAYHGDDGGRYSWHSYAADPGDAWSSYVAGDTVGCGIEQPDGRIFFTKNGELLGYPFEDKVKETGLIPVVGFRGRVSFSVNMGSDAAVPFKWAEANRAAWRKPMLGI